MKNKLITTVFFFGLMLLSVLAIAQRRAPRSAYDTNPSSSNNKETTTPVKKQSPATQKQSSDTTKPLNNSVDYNSLPIEEVEGEGNEGLFGTTKQSMRKDNILEDSRVDSTAVPLPYTALYSSDALFRVRVWRTIDARTQKNSIYFYNKDIEGGDDTRLVNLMLKAIKDDSVQAFSNIDDRFTTPISFDEALGGFGGGKDTSAKYDMDGNVSGYEVRTRTVSPDSVYKFRIKEEWLFNKRDGKTYVRILGIAPVYHFVSSDGYVMENSEHAVFWIYYPDLRKTLVRNRINNPLKIGGSLTWEEVFENRLFESTIIKSTLDAENGFNNTPLNYQQAETIESQLGNLSNRLWETGK